MVVRKVDSLEWLREREEVYQKRLERASLEVEADYSLQDVKTICRSFGHVHDWHVRSGRAGDTGFGPFPNCLLVAMVGTAATSPEPNVFWPAFWSATVISHTSELQTRVGDMFLEALTRRRLATFSQVVTAANLWRGWGCSPLSTTGPSSSRSPVRCCHLVSQWTNAGLCSKRSSR